MSSIWSLTLLSEALLTWKIKLQMKGLSINEHTHWKMSLHKFLKPALLLEISLFSYLSLSSASADAHSSSQKVRSKRTTTTTTTHPVTRHTLYLPTSNKLHGNRQVLFFLFHFSSYLQSEISIPRKLRWCQSYHMFVFHGLSTEDLLLAWW